MPHKCIRCGKVFENGSKELMSGCDCGSRVFIFLKEGQKIDLKKLIWLEKELEPLSHDKPVSIDLDAVENIRILETGKYELNIKSLMQGDPLIVKSDKGIYYIKLPTYRKEEKALKSKE